MMLHMVSGKLKLILMCTIHMTSKDSVPSFLASFAEFYVFVHAGCSYQPHHQLFQALTG